jgi:VanZ family protein
VRQISRWLRSVYWGLPKTLKGHSVAAWVAALSARPKVIYLLWIVLWLVVATGELIPGDSTPMELLAETHISDKLIHSAAYAALGFVPAFALRFRTAVKCAIGAELGGICLELAQLVAPGRTCDFWDAAANTVGLLVGTGLALLARWILLRRSELDR